MNKLLRKARHLSGIARFERKCCLKPECGRMRKAYRVPGTQEAGIWATLDYWCNRIYQELLAQEKNNVHN